MNSKLLKPVDDKVIVKVIKDNEKITSSGLILSSTENNPNQGIVVAVGPGLVLDNGVTMKPDLSVGERVVFAKYQGTTVNNGGEELLILAYRDIVAVIEE
jgi:chaperonin GroES